MRFEKLLHIILIFTLILQLFPTTISGKFFMFGQAKEECMDMSGAAKNQLKQVNEEQHKEIHLESHGLILTLLNLTVFMFHFSEMLPLLHFDSIPTPPPNFA
jgi:hypothetical protein